MADVLVFPSDALVGPLVEPHYDTVSGTVTVNGSPASRRVLIYKAGITDVIASTLSDISGNFSVDVLANNNDSLRVVIVGEAGENSIIFEHV